MDIFISWSGNRSLEVANALKEWLPLVIQSVTPWLSADDIDKGARWSSALSEQLEKSKMGIICVTSENMENPWLLFEAGALSKTLDSSLVTPFLFDLEPSELKGPMAQFQATRAIQDDVLKFLITVNKNTESSLGEQQLNKMFTKFWPDLEETLKTIGQDDPIAVVKPRPVPELLSEVLERVRSIERTITATAKKAEILDALNQGRSITEKGKIISALSKLRIKREVLSSKLPSAPESERADLELRINELKDLEFTLRNMLNEQYSAN